MIPDDLLEGKITDLVCCRLVRMYRSCVKRRDEGERDRVTGTRLLDPVTEANLSLWHS